MHKKPFVKRKRSLFPTALGDAIQPVTRPVFEKKGLAGSRIITDWQQIVGPALASRCVPIKLSFPKGKTVDGTLTIAAENGFAPELQHMQPVIIEKLATYFGYKAVDRIRISHTLPRPTPAPKKHRPVTHQHLSHIHDELIEQIKDSELKNTLRSYASTLSGKTTDK